MHRKPTLSFKKFCFRKKDQSQNAKTNSLNNINYWFKMHKLPSPLITYLITPW